MTHDDRSARTGTIVGSKYRVVGFIAEGGMGTVYEAQHVMLKRRFAVKFLRGMFATRRDALARFRREAIALGSLESENIAAAVDFGVAPDSTPFIVMEYLEGQDVACLLAQSGPLPTERAADIVIQVCHGIQVAHDNDLIHRDLKPKNLVLCCRDDGSDLVKIVDFGLAKLLSGSEQDTASGAGGQLGTAAYMSPEQAQGHPHIDQRTDVYSLGVILYELLCGSTPHPGTSYNAILHHILTQEPLPLPETVPQPLARIIMRALARQPSDRYSSASDLELELAPFAQRRRWQPPATEAPSALGSATTLPAPSDSSAFGQSVSGSTERPRTPGQGARGWSKRASVVAGVLSLAGLGLWWLVPQSPRATSADKDGERVAPSGAPEPAPRLTAAKTEPAIRSKERHETEPIPLASAAPIDEAVRPESRDGRPHGQPAARPAGALSASPQSPPPRVGVQASFDRSNPYE